MRGEEVNGDVDGRGTGAAERNDLEPPIGSLPMMTIDQVADAGGLTTDVTIMGVLTDARRNHRITVQPKGTGHVEHQARPASQLVELLGIARVRHQQRHVQAELIELGLVSPPAAHRSDAGA